MYSSTATHTSFLLTTQLAQHLLTTVTRMCVRYVTRCICHPFLLYLFLCDTFQPKSTFATSVCMLLSTVHIECRFKSHRRCAPSVTQGCKWVTRECIERDGEKTVDNVSTSDTTPAHLTTQAHLTLHKHTSHYTSTPHTTPAHLTLHQNTSPTPAHLSLHQHTYLTLTSTPLTTPEHLTLHQHTSHYTRTPHTTPAHLTLHQHTSH